MILVTRMDAPDGNGFHAAIHFRRTRMGALGRALLLAVGLTGSSFLAVRGEASAQLQVPWLRGGFGLLAGSSPSPGVGVIGATTWYHAGEVKDRDGNTFASGDLGLLATSAGLTYTSSGKLLGAHWGGMIFLTLANSAIDLPALDVQTGFGPGDLYIRPINLGWHWPQGDLTLAYGLFLPTGRYVPEGAKNTGLGMWSNEYDLGGTVYFDRARAWHASTMASYQSQSAKAGTHLHPGSTVTLYGGAGHAFKAGLANAGIAYYAQWKVSDDEIPVLPEGLLGRHRIFGIGPEIDYPIHGAPAPLIATARYFFEVGNRVATQGGTLYLGLTYLRPDPPSRSGASGGRR